MVKPRASPVWVCARAGSGAAVGLLKSSRWVPCNGHLYLKESYHSSYRRQARERSPGAKRLSETTPGTHSSDSHTAKSDPGAPDFVFGLARFGRVRARRPI